MSISHACKRPNKKSKSNKLSKVFHQLDFIFNLVSLFENFFKVHLPKLIPSLSQINFASSGCELPPNTLMFGIFLASTVSSLAPDMFRILFVLIPLQIINVFVKEHVKSEARLIFCTKSSLHHFPSQYFMSHGILFREFPYK